MHTKYPLFQIFYSTTFTILFIALLCLLLITPGDIIRQALKNRQIYSIFIVAGVSILTLISTIIIYASRLFTNRSVLASIPKEWIPIEKDDVKRKKVWKMIAEGLERSALITRAARPRDLGRITTDDETGGGKSSQTEEAEVAVANDDGLELKKQESSKRWSNKRMDDDDSRDEDLAVLLNSNIPFWGVIEHPGWSAPSTRDFPSLHYRAVITELPHLLEAKAVSLAPQIQIQIPLNADDDDHDGDDDDVEGAADHQQQQQQRSPPSTTIISHPAAVSLLQRPISMGMRDYLSHLTNLDLIRSSSSSSSSSPEETCTVFIALYEHARFSGHELTESEFRTLMNLFTDILRGMVAELSDDVIATLIQAENNDEVVGRMGQQPATIPSAGRSPSSKAASTSATSSTTNTTTSSSGTGGDSIAHADSDGSSSTSSTRQWRQMTTAPTTPFIPRTESPSSMSASSPSSSSSSSSSSSDGRRRLPITTYDDAQSIVSTISSAGSVVRYHVPTTG